jgi:hypothetical protein
VLIRSIEYPVVQRKTKDIIQANAFAPGTSLRRQEYPARSSEVEAARTSIRMRRASCQGIMVDQ